MPESTARVERYEPQSAVRPFYVWDVPQKPLSIRLGLNVIESLEREVVASFRSVSARGSEIGGLLLGKTLAGPQPVVSVEAYELIACDYTRGPLYRLSEKDLESLDEFVRQNGRDARGLSVVGMFRSNTRKELACDADDLELMKRRFEAPENVLLLVKPYATKPASAGFFIWEDGSIASASHLEFPFTRAALVAANAVRAIPAEEGTGAVEEARQPEPPHAAPVPPPPAAPAPARPAVRAQVVPIASRREPPAPPPLPTIEPEAPVPAPPEPEKAAAAPEPEPERAAPEPLPEPAPAPQLPARPMFGVAAEAAPERGGSGKLVWILGVSAAAAILLVALFVYPGLLLQRGAAPAPPPAENAGLALRVERTAGQLLLTWNREADAIKAATRAVLTISDGPQRENVELDLAQLRNGSVVYSPLTGDVGFRLEVVASTPELSKSEHVRVLGTKPSAMTAVAPETAAPAAARPEPAPSAMEAAAEEAGQTPAATPQPPRESLGARLGQSDTLGQRLRPARSSDLPEPPALGSPSAGVSHASGLPVALPQAPARPAPAPPPSAAPAMRVGGVVQEAQVISRAEPAYPPLARSTRVQGIVQLEAVVGSDGRVKSVKVVSGHPLLRQAAADAVKKWLYRPSLLNGVAVEVTTRVAVGFSLAN